MRHRHAGECGAQSTAKGARRIPLNDDEHRSFDCRTEASRHQSNVPVRIGLPSTAELRQREACQVECRGIKVRMLAGENDPRKNSKACELSCYG
jgi:hypothetical protein